MSGPREIQVTCPCCDTVLWVDVRTQKVLRRKAASELDDFGKPKAGTSWEEATGRVSGRMGSAEDKFDAGLARERGKTKNLDDLFKKASEKLKDGEDDE